MIGCSESFVSRLKEENVSGLMEGVVIFARVLHNETVTLLAIIYDISFSTRTASTHVTASTHASGASAIGLVAH